MAGPTIRVHRAPSQVEPGALAGAFVLVVDLLRASTTIVHAINSGAAAVIPYEEIEDARARAAATPGVLLGGERGGLRVDGFDLGNSPTEYTPERVGGRTVIFTTTNGTRAIHRARGAETVAIACLANLAPAVDAANTAHHAGRPVHILCAGVDGEPCLDDLIGAGAIVDGLAKRWRVLIDHDTALWAASAWSRAQARPGGLVGALRATPGGQNLIAAGLDADIPVCAAIDTCPRLPVYDASSGSIVAG